MFVLSNFLVAAARVLDLVLQLYTFIIIARALISWVSPDPFNPIVQFLNRATEPVLGPIRRLLPPSGIDVSPIIVLFAIYFLRTFLVSTLMDIAYSLPR